MGEYRFKPTFKKFEINSSRWFVMTPQQREKHLKKVFEIGSLPVKHPSTASSSEKGSRQLSVPAAQSGVLSLSSELLERMWGKAERLLNSTGSVCLAPGMKDAMCVASDAAVRPHTVLPA